MVGDMETGNDIHRNRIKSDFYDDITEGSSVKGKMEVTQDRALG